MSTLLLYRSRREMERLISPPGRERSDPLVVSHMGSARAPLYALGPVDRLPWLGFTHASTHLWDLARMNCSTDFPDHGASRPASTMAHNGTFHVYT